MAYLIMSVWFEVFVNLKEKHKAILGFHSDWEKEFSWLMDSFASVGKEEEASARVRTKRVK